jgi:hypothetical protein
MLVPCKPKLTAPASGSTGFGFSVVVVVGATVVVEGATVVVGLAGAGAAGVDVVVDAATPALRGALPTVDAAKKPATKTHASALEPTITFFMSLSPSPAARCPLRLHRRYELIDARLPARVEIRSSFSAFS